MDRIDRLLRKVKPENSCKFLSVDNPYMSMNWEQLIDMLCPDTPGGYQAPEMRTKAWDKFMYALISAKE